MNTLLIPFRVLNHIIKSEPRHIKYRVQLSLYILDTGQKSSVAAFIIGEKARARGEEVRSCRRTLVVLGLDSASFAFFLVFTHFCDKNMTCAYNQSDRIRISLNSHTL